MNLKFYFLIFSVIGNLIAAQHGTKPLIYGGDLNYPPYEYLNQDGIPEGFNIDVINAIAKEMNFSIKFKLDDWSEIRKELEETNLIDISDMFYSTSRDSLVDFSIPFTIAYDEIFTREETHNINSLDDIGGKSVIVQNMSFIYDKLKSNYPDANLITVENEPEALLKLSQGIGDCAILSQTVTRMLFQLKKYSNIKRVGSPIFPKEYSFVVKNGNSVLLRTINNGLILIKDKKILDEIENKWFGQKEEYETVRKFLTYLIYVLVVLSIITLGIIYWNRTLKNQVLIKTKDLVYTHKKLTDTLENMDEGFFWITKNWQIENINKKAAMLVGKNPKEILLTNFLETYPILKDFVYEKYLTALETQRSDFFEFYNKKTKQWFENRIIPSENGLAIFIKEITEKKKSEELLKESESNLKSLIENWTESIWAIDQEYNYIIYNNFYYEQIENQFDIELQKGMNALIQLDETERKFWKSNYDIALKGNKIAFEISEGKNQNIKYYEIFLNPIFVDNYVKGVSAFRIDITNSKNREIQLTEAKEKAEKSNKLKTEFLAQISHEIRTPINNILNYTGLLVEISTQENTEENKLIFESIESSSRRIMRTIDLILNLSDIQLGSYESIMKRLDLVIDVVIPVFEEYKFAAEKKNIKIELNYNVNDFLIHGDSYSLFQIVSNLIDNAIKYTNKGEVKVSIEENDENEIILNISDTGIGISEEYLPNIFEPFSQEEQGYTRSFDGTGIGLALVKKYCEINKVSIEVKSKKSVGTTFSLYFEKIPQ